MLSFSLFKSAGKFLTIAFLLLNVFAHAQQVEYRITEEGKYEHLSDLKETGMIYDESNGSYYKPISSRTFFLEAQKRGYIAADVLYTQFVQLPIVLQIAAVNQPLAEVIDCSTNYTSSKCLRFKDILELKKLPLTQLERAKIFLRAE